MRGLTEAEDRLLSHLMRWGSDGYPVRRLGRDWAWGNGEVKGPPTIFRTKREAVTSFEQFQNVLLDAKAGRI